MTTEAGDDSEIGDLGPSEYLIYRVLTERHTQDNLETGRTRIHKLCCLADRRLQEEYDREIGIPKYWYKYGRTISESENNDVISFTPDANHYSGQAYYPADRVDESDFDHLSEDLKDDIFHAVREVIEQHGKKHAEELEEYQYKNYAPNDFIKAYADLRWYLDLISEDESQSRFSNFVSPDEKTRIEEMLDEMLISFDEGTGEEIYDIYLEWDDTMRLLNDLGRSPRELHDFTETFVEGIAKITLRRRYNSNISQEKLDEWEEDKEKVKEDLRRKIERKRRDALAQRTDSSEIDQISESYNEAIFSELEDL